MGRSTKGQTHALLRSENPVRYGDRQRKQTDWLIGLRESLLNRLSGANDDDVLNVPPAGSLPEFGIDPAIDLKRALERIKLKAMDESGTRVDYAGLRASDAYQEFRANNSSRLCAFDPAGLTSLEGRTAFWINLYNALTIDAVIAIGVQTSVREDGLGRMAFFRKAAYNVAGLRMSLDDIEHGILRANRGHPYLPGRHFSSKDPRLAWMLPLDARLHFALNCASRSCPPIQVYSPDHLEAQLDLAARNFVDSDVKIIPAKNLLVVSSIFRWYKGDFGGRDGIVTFLIDHLPDDERRGWLSRNKEAVKLRYQPYDWNLNTVE